MSVDAKMMTVVRALSQSIQTSAGPGTSVNAHPNPFFINVNGALDLKHAATLVLERIEAFEVGVKAKIEKSIKEADAKAAAEAKVADDAAVADAKAKLAAAEEKAAADAAAASTTEGFWFQHSIDSIIAAEKLHIVAQAHADAEAAHTAEIALRTKLAAAEEKAAADATAAASTTEGV